jgi:hypothetical protein
MVESKKKKRCSLTFPWWCVFVAYGLSLIFAIISIFFIIARGIEFGDLKTQKWLTSLITGFFSSIFLIQPIKVFSLIQNKRKCINFSRLGHHFSNYFRLFVSKFR